MCVVTNLVHELSDNTVPLAGLEVVDAVLAIGHQLDAVLEADHACDHAQQVDAEALVPVVARQVALAAHHHVGCLLGVQTSNTTRVVVSKGLNTYTLKTSTILTK
jgi:hypothetical protein